MKFPGILIFCFSFISFHAQAAFNKDSLAADLRHTLPDSASTEKNLQLFSSLPNDEYEAKMMVVDWLINATTQTRNYEGLARTYLRLGHYQLQRQEYTKATESFNLGLDISERISSFKLMGAFYSMLGTMSYDFLQFDESIAYYKKAIEYTAKAGDPESDKSKMATYYYNLSGMYFEKSERSGNLDTINMAIELAKTALNLQMSVQDTMGAITSKNGLAMMYSMAGLKDSALKQLDESQILIDAVHAENRYVLQYMRYAQTYSEMGDFSRAIDFLNKGYVYVEKYQATRWQYIYYRYYAIVYAGLGDYKNANEYNEKYIILRDSLVNSDNYAAMQNVQARYETERKEKEILQLNKDNEINELKLYQNEQEQKNLEFIVISALTVLVVFIVLLIILARVNVARKLTNAELHNKNREIQEQSVVMSNQSKLISRYQSQMNPHFIFNALNSLQGMVLRGENEKTHSQLQVLSKLMRITLNNSERELIPLEEEIDYLNLYLKFEQVKFPVELAFTTLVEKEAEETLLPPMLIQPLIENAVKHARLHEVENPSITVSFAVFEKALKLVIKDNGMGFPGELHQLVKSSHALAMIQVRLKALWEKEGLIPDFSLFEVRSATGEGFTIEIYVPLIYQH